MIPGGLVTLGMSINLFLAVSQNPSLIGQAGLIVPWFLFLAMPALISSKIFEINLCWKYFNYILCILVSLSLVEYFLAVNGLIPIKLIVTDGGKFAAANFTLFYPIDFDIQDLHYRFYASFNEPGSLSMMIIPALSYSLFRKKYLYVFIYGLAIYFTDSLGAYAALLVMFPIFFFINGSKKVYCTDIFCNFCLFSLLLFYRFSN